MFAYLSYWLVLYVFSTARRRLGGAAARPGPSSDDLTICEAIFMRKYARKTSQYFVAFIA